MVRLLRQLPLTPLPIPNNRRLLQRRRRVEKTAQVLSAQQLIASDLRVQLAQQHLVKRDQLTSLDGRRLAERGQFVGLEKERLLKLRRGGVFGL